MLVNGNAYVLYYYYRILAESKSTNWAFMRERGMMQYLNKIETKYLEQYV